MHNIRDRMHLKANTHQGYMTLSRDLTITKIVLQQGHTEQVIFLSMDYEYLVVMKPGWRHKILLY